jgi:hypothetical protein
VREIRMLRSTWRGLETWHGRDGVTLANERARQRRTQTSTYTGAPVLDPTCAFDLGERWLGPANKVDYLIRRRLIPDHPCESDRAFARALPFRYSSHYPSWEFARMTLHSPAMRGNSVLHGVQAAIGRCLSAEYDIIQEQETECFSPTSPIRRVRRG